MENAHRIRDTAGAPGTGAPIVVDLDGARKTFLTLRAHQLQFDACHCGITGPVCLTCRRWQRHYRAVLQRRQAWGVKP